MFFPGLKFNESISFVVHCQTQKEVDYYWKKLTAGGKERQCGGLQDKFGVLWQITPTVFLDIWKSKDEAKRERAMAALMP